LATVSDFAVATGEGGTFIRIDELRMFREFPHAVQARNGERWRTHDRDCVAILRHGASLFLFDEAGCTKSCHGVVGGVQEIEK